MQPPLVYINVVLRKKIFHWAKYEVRFYIKKHQYLSSTSVRGERVSEPRLTTINPLSLPPSPPHPSLSLWNSPLCPFHSFPMQGSSILAERFKSECAAGPCDLNWSPSGSSGMSSIHFPRHPTRKCGRASYLLVWRLELSVVLKLKRTVLLQTRKDVSWFQNDWEKNPHRRPPSALNSNNSLFSSVFSLFISLLSTCSGTHNAAVLCLLILPISKRRVVLPDECNNERVNAFSAVRAKIRPNRISPIRIQWLTGLRLLSVSSLLPRTKLWSCFSVIGCFVFNFLTAPTIVCTLGCLFPPNIL